MSSVSYHIANLLEKMGSSDKDYRFMATNDLMAELQKDSIKLDDDSERKVVRMLLKLLEDKNGEVQNLAVRCLGPLVNKVKEYQVEQIVDALCTNMVSDKEQLRDISSIGLKTVISELPPASGGLASNVCKKITGRLTAAITKQDDVSVQLEALDILGDLLLRFGGLLLQFHPNMQQALLPQLASARLAVRKRSIVALSYLVQSSSGPLFEELIQFLLQELKKNSNPSTTRTYVQCIVAISRQAGHRLGELLPLLLPVIMSFCHLEDDELREYCIQAFEAFVLRCPKDVSQFVPQIQELCLHLLTYDPNYNYDDDDGDFDMDMDDEEEDEEEDFSDDDDVSWKVRRASAKCLEAIISSRHDLLLTFYSQIARPLISRFKEREENVKADIFAAYIALLRQTRAVCCSAAAAAQEEHKAPLAMLEAQVSDIVRAVQKHMRDKSIKTRQGCNSLLSELVAVLPGVLSQHLAALIPGIQFSLNDKSSSSNMKIDTLSFLHTLLVAHPCSAFHPHVELLVPLVVTAVADPFYKITSEALLVTLQLVKVIRPLDGKSQLDPKPYAGELYRATLVRLKAADIDQEVKERAIAAMGQLFANMGDLLEAELRVCAPIFLERLKNEITRLTTVKAITLIASSPLGVSLHLLLDGSLPVLSSFLRKNMRALKLATLQCLNTFVIAYGASFTAAMLQEVMRELPALINEVDSHISQLTLVLLHSICQLQPQSMQYVLDSDILRQVITLVQSPLLHGQALSALLDLLQALSQCGLPQLSFQQLSTLLLEPVYGPGKQAAHLHKQSYHSVARCLAALLRVCPAEVPRTTKQLLQDLKKPHSDSVSVVALLTIGEIGSTCDMSGQTELQNAVLLAFTSANEEVKSAASYALGNMAIGNLRHFVPFVLKEIHTQPKRQYLLLHSLKEIITHLSSRPEDVAVLQPHIDSIWELLLQHCGCAEEGTRNVVAECLGKLTLLDPHALLPRLKRQLSSDEALVRGAAVTAVKYTISDQPQPIDSLLQQDIGEFLNTLHDPDLGVRQVALVSFNSAAHNKPGLIRDRLDRLLPYLYEETKKRKELERQVEMGPFKHVVDDGLDLRKAAFECMYTLLDSCLDRLDVFEFLTHVESGLKDHDDIKMLTDLMVARLATQAPGAVLQRIDHLVEPLKATCGARVKANSVKQEYEKQDELKRSALRAFAALLAIPDAERSPQVAEFLNQIKSGELNEMFNSVQRDAAASSSDSAVAPMETN